MVDALEFMKKAKGRIVSSGDLTTVQISEFLASGSFFIDPETCLGWADVPWDLTTEKDRIREKAYFEKTEDCLREWMTDKPVEPAHRKTERCTENRGDAQRKFNIDTFIHECIMHPDEVIEHVSMLWKEYALEKDERLTEGAKELKYKLLRAFPASVEPWPEKFEKKIGVCLSGDSGLKGTAKSIPCESEAPTKYEPGIVGIGNQRLRDDAAKETNPTFQAQLSALLDREDVREILSNRMGDGVFSASREHVSMIVAALKALAEGM